MTRIASNDMGVSLTNPGRRSETQPVTIRGPAGGGAAPEVVRLGSLDELETTVVVPAQGVGGFRTGTPPLLDHLEVVYYLTE